MLSKDDVGHFFMLDKTEDHPDRTPECWIMESFCSQPSATFRRIWPPDGDTTSGAVGCRNFEGFRRLVPKDKSDVKGCTVADDS